MAPPTTLALSRGWSQHSLTISQTTDPVLKYCQVCEFCFSFSLLWNIHVKSIEDPVHQIARNRNLSNRLYCWFPIDVQGGSGRLLGIPFNYPCSFPRAPPSTSSLALQAPGVLSFLLALPGISHLARPQLRGLDIWQHKQWADRLGHGCASVSPVSHLYPPETMPFSTLGTINFFSGLY